MTAAITERPKLDVLRAKEAELAIEVDAARARIAAYPEQLHEARSRAIYAKPNVRPGAELNSEVSKLNAKEKKDLDGLRALEADLSACRGVLAIEAQRLTEEATVEARAQLTEFHAKEEAIWKQAAELFGELAGVWNAYATLAEEEDRFAGVNRLEGPGPGVLAVEPAPLTFRSFLLLLLAASTDANVRAEPFTEQLADIGAFGRRDDQGNDIGGVVYEVRPAGTRQVETRRKLDYGDRLYHVVPDLRSVVRALNVSGRIPKFTAE